MAKSDGDRSGETIRPAPWALGGAVLANQIFAASAWALCRGADHPRALHPDGKTLHQVVIGEFLVTLVGLGLPYALDLAGALAFVMSLCLAWIARPGGGGGIDQADRDARDLDDPSSG